MQISTQKSSAPSLGDAQWSHVLTFTVSGQTTVVKQTAVRGGDLLMVVAGSPALVDRRLRKALAKPTATG
ncbi:hypothetical protein [Streptomyces sp. NPDC058045]|uniref:hypothetical protein n=1 Tax=Streptomyces sp. NPDC058045 TaxID=3346311 RepID=UPI0036E5D5AE